MLIILLPTAFHSSLSETEHAARALATTATVGILTEDDGVIEAVSSEVDETKPEERLAEDAVLNRFSAMYAICKVSRQVPSLLTHRYEQSLRTLYATAVRPG